MVDSQGVHRIYQGRLPALANNDACGNKEHEEDGHQYKERRDVDMLGIATQPAVGSYDDEGCYHKATDGQKLHKVVDKHE